MQFATRRYAGGCGALLAASIGLLSLMSAGSSAFAADKLNEFLPENIRKAGEIHVASNSAYPPFAFKNEAGEASGVESDLLRAMAEKLGVKIKFTSIDFPSILPGVTAGRFDVGSGGFNNTEERRKVVEFVNYANAVSGIVVQKGNPNKISINDLCGKTIAASEGSAQRANLGAISDKCTAQGKAAIEMPTLKGTPAMVVALKSQRVQGVYIDLAVASYLVGKDTTIEALPGVVPNPDGSKVVMGVLMKKGDVQLAKALQAGLNAAIKDGTYGKILKQWGIADDIKLQEATIN
jgi:polar amino acid transport system substrate-binding protein